MAQYLTKEEIKQWRSSLERITLEKYAQRLGKQIQPEKETRDIVDIVLEERNSNYITSKWEEDHIVSVEKISNINSKAFEIEQKIVSHKVLNSNTEKKDPVKKNKRLKNIASENKLAKKNIAQVAKEKLDKILKKKEKQNIEKRESTVQNVDIISFKKPLTKREQIVFDYFMKNKKVTVYAKDLAEILDLPRDYVYKYIKNLRAKMNEEILINSDKGGYSLNI